MRASLVFVAGALAGGLMGGTGTYLALRAAGTESPAPLGGGSLSADRGLAPADGFDPEATGAGAAAMSTSERLALYEYATARSSPDELESLIRRAASLPPSRRRGFELDALLIRLAEHDTPRAARFARALGLEAEFLVPLFQLWAERDAGAALDELSRIDNPGAVRTIALALLDVFGDDERGMARLESVLSAPQMQTLRVEAVLRLVDRDPIGALRRALSLADFSSRSTAVSGLAREWARRDPTAAIARSNAIADGELRLAYQNGVIAEWARIDPESALAYVRSEADGRSVAASLPAIQSLAAAAPEALLARIEELPLEMRSFARQAAIAAIADRDPRAAIAMLETIPNTRERDQLVAPLADAYARRDAEAALEWARSVRPQSINAVATVLARIAETDPDRALDLLFEDDPRLGPISSLAMISVFRALPDSSRLAAVADRMIARPDFRWTSQMRMLVSSWSARDPEAALDWFLANAERVDRATLAPIAEALATRDPEAAIRAVDRLPPHLRADWIAQAASGYAQHDAEAAATWIMQYRGQPGFDAAVGAIARRAATSQPRTVIRLLERLGRPMDAPVAGLIASSWALREPAAAAEWVMRLPAETQRSSIDAVASAWNARDPDGAKRWVLSLPRGDLRDQALGTMVPNALLLDGSPDAALLDAFSSDAARQNAVLRVILPLASRDREAARRLIDTYITDPALRRQTYDRIDGISVNASAPDGFFAPSVSIRAQ